MSTIYRYTNLRTAYMYQPLCRSKISSGLAGAAPSCCIKPIRSMVPQRSAILPVFDTEDVDPGENQLVAGGGEAKEIAARVDSARRPDLHNLVIGSEETSCVKWMSGIAPRNVPTMVNGPAMPSGMPGIGGAWTTISWATNSDSRLAGPCSRSYRNSGGPSLYSHELTLTSLHSNSSEVLAEPLDRSRSTNSAYAPADGTAPSCWTKVRVSAETHRSTILPSTRRTKSLWVHLSCLPLGRNAEQLRSGMRTGHNGVRRDLDPSATMIASSTSKCRSGKAWRSCA